MMSKIRPLRLSRRERSITWLMQAKILRAVADAEELSLRDGHVDDLSGPDVLRGMVDHLRDLALARLSPSKLRRRSS